MAQTETVDLSANNDIWLFQHSPAPSLKPLSLSGTYRHSTSCIVFTSDKH